MRRMVLGLAVGSVLLLGLGSTLGSEADSRETEAFIVGFHELPEDRFQYAGEDVSLVNEDLAFFVVDAADASSLKAHAKQDDAVRYIEKDTRSANLLFVPDDAEYEDQYGPQIVRSESAWETALGSTSVTIGLLDSGLNPHDDFDGDAISGWNYFHGDPWYVDEKGCDFHGTHVSGIAAAITDNGFGIAGMANPSIIMHKIFDWGSTPCVSASSSEIAEAMTDMADEGPHVISNSWGQTDAQAIIDAIDYTYEKGIPQVAAAGNFGCADCVVEPWVSRPDKVIIVSASDAEDEFWSSSSEGSEVDVMAPGVDILSAHGGDETGFQTLSGTSMSAPHVAGAIALHVDAHGHANHSVMEQRVRETAEDLEIYETRQGEGRLNAGLLVSGEDGLVRPMAAFQATCTELACTFDASETIVGKHPVDTYGWVLGDGANATGPMVEHTYGANDTYRVNLTVTNSIGNHDQQPRSTTATVVDKQTGNATLFQDGFENGKLWPWIHTQHEAGWVDDSLWRVMGDKCYEPPEGDYLLSFSTDRPNQFCNYDEGLVLGWVSTPEIEASVYDTLTLIFQHFFEVYDTDDPIFDRMRVQVSTDGGQAYETVARWDATDHTNGDWEEVSLDISEFASDRLMIRFHFDSGNHLNNNYPGWYIDDVRVVGSLDDAMHVHDVSIQDQETHARVEAVVYDEHEEPVSGANASIEACDSGGACQVKTDVTGSDGIASVTWKHESAQTLEACVIGLEHGERDWVPGLDHAEDGSCPSGAT